MSGAVCFEKIENQYCATVNLQTNKWKYEYKWSLRVLQFKEDIQNGFTLE